MYNRKRLEGSYSDGSLPAELTGAVEPHVISECLELVFEIRLVSNAEEKEALEYLWETGPCNNVKLLEVHANT
jgi:hypothetical protein